MNCLQQRGGSKPSFKIALRLRDGRTDKQTSALWKLWRCFLSCVSYIRTEAVYSLALNIYALLSSTGAWTQADGEQKTLRVAQSSDHLQCSTGYFQRVAVLRSKCPSSELALKEHNFIIKENNKKKTLHIYSLA